MPRVPLLPIALAGAWTLVLTGLPGGCAGEEPPPEAPVEAPEAEKAPRPDGELPTLVVVQAQFVREGGKPKPGPAKMVLLATKDGQWWEEVVEDPESNVFHKGMPWRDGILTIGAQKAMLKHWTRDLVGTWRSTLLWEKSWGGKFDRLRDVELGDLDGDGKDEMAIATHDMGVVAVGTENDGTWTFAEMDQEADTFVHEIEIGDVDGDGKAEFYATPSERNRASGESQPGGVVRYDYRDGGYVRSQVVHWEESHAKEILVADTDGDGKDELYAVREAHSEKDAAGAVKMVDPVRIVRYTPADGGWSDETVATLEDHQTRFLVPGDVTGDGKADLIAAGMKSGLWLLQRKEDGTFDKTLIDADSGGFEHATHLADLDGDGRREIYVAADNQREIRRYVWNGKAFDRETIARIPPDHITWNIQDGRF